MTLEIKIVSTYKRDIKKISRQGKNLEELSTVIEKLIEEIELPQKYKDHQLTGNWNRRRECHIRSDWLLIYKIENGILYLERTGSHSELFG